ncbi:hypothetical protein M9980_11015 [Sphingomonas donggukensis]|uniref:DUF11 domain-containing protein n=1 Tax=Sphingomonas donggukensis TaxID=2949093 RepID=A0ABY4TRR4_9SPHN|nr:hypothetical protein [Sphingomonas donggukensis]URW75086.1 hypothetical protein M9980_11015 [Sphingomonas donggukensis]
MTRTRLRLGAATTLVLAALAASPAWAGTTAGQTVTNTVQVSYTVGGVAQTPVSASDTFTVDRKVAVTVAEVGSTTTSVSPGQASAVTTFQVTNSSNATLDFALTAVQQTGGAGAHSNTDNFDATNVRVFVDTNGNGSWDAGDAQIAYLDELAADASKTVFVVADIPVARVNGDVAAVTLTATGREGGAAGSQGAALTQTTGANTAAMDTVFADAAGATDGARDGAHSARDDYTVFGAVLTVLKTSRVISDPVNLTTNPKMIPGAVVEYCISVANAAGAAPAANIALSDVLPAATTYQSSFGNLVNGTLSGGTCAADGTSGGSFAANTVTATIPTVAAGDARTLVFRVTVN